MEVRWWVKSVKVKSLEVKLKGDKERKLTQTDLQRK